jgi:competence protein ComEC
MHPDARCPAMVAANHNRSFGSGLDGSGPLGCGVQPLPSTQHSLTAYADGLSRQVRGLVVRVRELPPQQEDSNHDKEVGWWAEKEEDEEAAATGALSVDLQVDTVEEVTPDVSQMVPETGGVRMNVIADKPPKGSVVVTTTNGLAPAANPGALPTLKCGDIVEAPMRLKLAEYYRDPGAWQYADYLLSQGIGAHASVRASR